MDDRDDDVRVINLVGAMALGIADAVAGDVTGDPYLDKSSAAALNALLDLARGGSVQTLSTLIGISHSGTVRLVDRLAGAGLVERRTGPDARTSSLALTRRGREVAVGVRRRRHAAISATLDGLTEVQRRQLGKICQTVISNITRLRLDIREVGGVPSGGALCRMCDPTACGRVEGACPAALTAADRTDLPSVQ